MKKLSREYYKMLEELQAIDFTLFELNLDHDTHPGDHAALNQYNSLSLQRNHMRKKFEAKFGPLTNFGNTPMGNHRWSEGPWPWEV